MRALLRPLNNRPALDAAIEFSPRFGGPWRGAGWPATIRPSVAWLGTTF